MEVLARLREIGYQIQVAGDTIHCHWRGAGKPDPDEVGPLVEELRQRKAEALEALREPQAEVPLPDPFDPEAYPPEGLIICLPDLKRPGRWIARRTGTLAPVGHGADQWEAIMDLDRLEREQEDA